MVHFYLKIWHRHKFVTSSFCTLHIFTVKETVIPYKCNKARRLLSSGACHHVVWYTGTAVSEHPAISIFRVEKRWIQLSSFEMLLCIYVTVTNWCDTLEENNLHIPPCFQNVKSQSTTPLWSLFVSKHMRQDTPIPT